MGGRISDARACFSRASEMGYHDVTGSSMQQMPLPMAEPQADCIFSIGTKVVINGLSSQTGQRLNGREGVVVCHHAQAGRFGVQLDGEDVKSIEPENLIPITSEEHFEDPDAQSAIEASLLQGDGNVNAQLSEAILKSSSQSSFCHVLLITYSRKPAVFREALLTDSRLHDCRQALLDRGFPVELSSGAKALVQPDQYEPLMEFIRLSCLMFASWHLFLDPSLESIVAEIIDEVNSKLRKKEKFYQKSAKKVPLEFAAKVQEMECKAIVLRTFIQIPVSSSMYSAQGSSQQHTASTTDAAEGRQGPNHRKYGASTKKP